MKVSLFSETRPQALLGLWKLWLCQITQVYATAKERTLWSCPDVSVGPVLGGQRQSRVTNTPPPTSTQERAYPGSFAPLASEGGPATKLSGTSCSMYANQWEKPSRPLPILNPPLLACNFQEERERLFKAICVSLCCPVELSAMMEMVCIYAV